MNHLARCAAAAAALEPKGCAGNIAPGNLIFLACHLVAWTRAGCDKNDATEIEIRSRKLSQDFFFLMLGLLTGRTVSEEAAASSPLASKKAGCWSSNFNAINFRPCSSSP